MEHSAEINEVYKLIKEIPDVQNAIAVLKANYHQWYFGSITGFQIVNVNSETFKHFVDTVLTDDNLETIPVELSVESILDEKTFCLSIGKRLKTQIHLHTPLYSDMLFDFINRNLIKL